MNTAAGTPTPVPTPDLSNLTDADLGPIPGLLSFVAFVLLAIAVYVLYRSMNRQLKRIDFPEDGQGDPARTGPTDTAAAPDLTVDPPQRDEPST